MIRSRLGLIGLCAMLLGLMAFTASSASAAEWLILNGKGQAKTAKELPALVVTEVEEKTFWKWIFKLTGIKAEVSCTTSTLEGAKLEGEGKLTNGMKITLKGCTMPVPAGNICTVKSPGAAVGTIVTKELKGALQTNGEILIEPKTGTAIFELAFEGAECTLPEGAQAVNGVIWDKDCEKNAKGESKITEHLVKHLIEPSPVHIHPLSIGSDTAEHLETAIVGSEWWILAGEHANFPWGAMIP